MPWVIYTSLVAGIVSLLLALWTSSRPGASRRANSAYACAVAFFVLAGALAAVDEKVRDADRGDSGSGESAGRSARAPSAASGPVLEYGFNASELGGFVGRARVVRGRTDNRLCLVAYFDRTRRLGANRSYKWWTTCGQDAKFRTVNEAQDRLALPPDWGPRNTRAVACVPSGSQMPYVRGTTAPKLSGDDGRTYRGGARQYRVLRFDTRWIVRYDRIRPAPARLPRVEAPC